MKEQARFWFVHAKHGGISINLAVSAFTERSARMQARKRLGPSCMIVEANPVVFAHAWVIDHGWSLKRYEQHVLVDAVRLSADESGVSTRDKASS